MGGDKKIIEIYSEKYDLHGVIEDYGVVSNLIFTHNGKEVSMSISLSPLSKEQPEEIGRKLMESYVEKMASHNERNLYWRLCADGWRAGRSCYDGCHCAYPARCDRG